MIKQIDSYINQRQFHNPFIASEQIEVTEFPEQRRPSVDPRLNTDENENVN